MTDFAEIESKWQRMWKEHHVYEADLPNRPKMFITAAYPYPNGLLHLGHLATYLPADFTARYYRMKGYDVLFPMGFHVTGPATTAFARAIQRGDKDVIEEYHRVHRVSMEDIESFKDPERIVEYFSEKIRENFEQIGLSIDWRRTFMTKDPPYTMFIRWQFTKLNEGGHLVKGAHPVIWCPSCGNAVGEADRLTGEDVEIVEFYLIKFTLEDGTILPAATLRPETVFGVTNMWLHPTQEYHRARIEGEEWIVGAEAVEKLRLQRKNVEDLGKFDQSSLFGEKCKNPVTGEEVVILPATFVQTSNATGVVMSVPAHAPLDYQALEDLRRDPSQLEKFGIDPSVVQSIEPIGLIEVAGYSKWPAVDIVKKMGISSQMETEKLEKATQTIYKKEFYEGVLGPATGKYAGQTVASAKDVLSRDFILQGSAEIMYETSGEVYCRCRTKCYVNVMEDQWFIDYGDPDWKGRTKDLLSRMTVIPEKLRKSFEYYVEWMKEKPCARKIGFGTPFILDPDWIVEPLSDSTIYMAYYTIARIINTKGIEAEKLTPDLFDYVFLGKGNPEDVSRTSRLDLETIRQLRQEFEAWYPNDLRFVGPDLVGNHATFFLFNHAAIFPEKHWPRGIAASGIVLSEGQKMSKSKGNAIPIADSLDTWGADRVRLWFAACAEFGQDINYEAALRNSVSKRLAWFEEKISEVSQKSASKRLNRTIDRWIWQRMNRRISLVEQHIESVSPRKAIQELMFETYNDLQYYFRRVKGDVDYALLVDIFDCWIRMMTPFAPHFCEEMWQRLGREPFVVQQKWPTPAADLGPDAEVEENLIRGVIQDVKNILSATGAQYSTLNLYVAEDWKRELYSKVAAAVLEGKGLKEVISEAMKDQGLREKGKAVVSFLQQAYSDLSKQTSRDLEAVSRLRIDEFQILTEESDFISDETGLQVTVQRASQPTYDPKKRASRAMPFKPAIYLE